MLRGQTLTQCDATLPWNCIGGVTTAAAECQVGFRTVIVRWIGSFLPFFLPLLIGHAQKQILPITTTVLKRISVVRDNFPNKFITAAKRE